MINNKTKKSLSVNKRQMGTSYEIKAEEYLMQKGYRILERNFSNRVGEIDIIAKQKEYFCFIEVKYRKSLQYGFPAEAVTVSKQKKIILGARKYRYEHKISSGVPCRFDVISICGNEIEHIENAFCLT